MAKHPTRAAAFAAVASAIPTIREQAYDAIRAAGTNGFTAEELAEHLGMDRSAVQPRTTELYNDGFITDSGQKRPNKSSGKNAKVWVAV